MSTKKDEGKDDKCGEFSQYVEMYRHKCDDTIHSINVFVYLFSRSASEAVGVELVGMKDVDGAFNAEMMKLTGHF